MSIWIIKALLQKALSKAPGGGKINYLLQRYVTRSLPIGNDIYVNKLMLAHRHLDVAGRYGMSDLPALRFYEFGAGYDLSMPIIFAAAGVRSQDVIDIKELARSELCLELGMRIANTPFFEETFHRKPDGRFVDLIRASGDKDIMALLKIGISYHAPCDASRTPFSDSAFDFISSTSVLEHVPASDIRAILTECHRLLAAGGIISCIIDLVDHFSYFDHSIPFYNYLRHSAMRWDLIYNSTMQYQNRLRPDDYLGLCRDAGFRILEWSIIKSQPDEMEYWRKRDIKGAFSRLDENTLSPKYIYAVLQK